MKLPEIQYSRAAGSQTISPGQAAAPDIAKIKLTQQVGEMAFNINDMANEITVNNANADYKQAMTNFKQMMAGSTKEKYSQMDLDVMGIGDQFDASEEPVAKWEIYNAALSQYMDDMRERHGSQIRSNASRKAWDMDTQEASYAELERGVQDAANMAVQGIANEQVARAASAMDAGEYDVAIQAYENNPIFDKNPAMQEIKREGIKAAETAQYGQQQQNVVSEAQSLADSGRITEAVAMLEEEAARHKDDDTVAGTPWDDAKHNSWAKTLDSAAKSLELEAEGDKRERINANQKAYINNALLAAENGQLNTEWILSNSSNPDITAGNVITANTILKNMSKYESPYAKHTPPLLVNETVAMIGNPEFSTADVMKFFEGNIGSYSVTDHADYLTDITERDDPVKIKGTFEPQKELTNKLGTYGITSTTSPQLTASLSSYLNTSIKAAAANKKPLTDDDITILIDDITMDWGAGAYDNEGQPIPVHIERGFGRFDADGANTWKAVADNDEEMIPEITRILQASGTPPTQANVKRVYKLLLKGE
jgi:hypothetical protein